MKECGACTFKGHPDTALQFSLCSTIFSQYPSSSSSPDVILVEDEDVDQGGDQPIECPGCNLIQASSTECVACGAPLLQDASVKGKPNGSSKRCHDEIKGQDENDQTSSVTKTEFASSPSSEAAVGAEGGINGIACLDCTYLNFKTSTDAASKDVIRCCEMCGSPLLSLDDQNDAAEAERRYLLRDDAGIDSANQEVWDEGRLIAQQQEDVQDRTGGIVENLMQVRLPHGSSMRLSTPPVIHYSQRLSDVLGHWSCGYRNLQCLTSSLLQHEDFKRVLYGGCGYVPKVQYIQRWLEWSWGKGFDEEGASHFGGRIAGKSDWIGACEVVALLRSFRIRAHLLSASMVQHQLQRQQQGDDGKSEQKGEEKASAAGSDKSSSSKGAGNDKGSDSELTPGEAIVEFARRYFERDWHSFDLDATIREVQKAKVGERLPPSSSSAAAAQNFFKPRGQFLDEAPSYRPPLLFQHQGHSRTIIGIEEKTADARSKGKERTVNLIIFDPASEGQKLFINTRDQRGWQVMLKRGMHTLSKEEYQLGVILSGLLNDEEYEASKIMCDETLLLPGAADYKEFFAELMI